MLKEVCNKTRPAPECLSSNYTVPWDSSKSLVKVTEEIYNITIAYIGTPIICVGIITSLLCTILFLYHPITQRTTRLLLIVNSVVDTCYLVMLATSHMVTYFLPSGETKMLCVKIIDGISNYLGLFRNWTIVLIAFERYMLICHPLLLKSKASDKWVDKALIGTSLCALLIRLPTALTIIFHGLKLCDASAIAFSIDGFTDITFFTIIPLAALVIFTVSIQMQTRRLRHWRMTQSSSNNKRNIAFERMNKRVHRTIMIVLFSFTILITPFLPNGLFRMLIAMGHNDCWVYLGRHITASMSYIGSILNSTTNCFVYVIIWPKFRKSLRRMFMAPFTGGAKLRHSISMDISRTEPQTLQDRSIKNQ